ncbi:hypothetical protein Clacol_002172 [Clathrus columnatus]|uniref:Protein kinase domain-containing protein n=1 Tax=Clathrus columnatus TaxID=1419009 RepID=A0AAV5A135_9AGAM|nr:hypothetical protein Clacol_002172 [Clathrus columnatus]
MSSFIERLWRESSNEEEILTIQELPSTGEVEETEAKRLWGSLRSWFLEKGYTLFELGKLRHSFPLLDTPSRDIEKYDYPYAFCGGDPPYLKSLAAEPLEAYYSDKVCFAQDAQGRHVAIKKLTNTDETRIHRFLFEKREILAENCILPILEILEHEGKCFAVMPRWGDDPCFPHSGSIGNVLHYIHCLLKAIHFLHSNSIVHRDLKEDNTLVNHFGAYRCNIDNMMRPKLRAAGKLTYVLYDFDLSLMLPSTECRLPASQSVDVLSIVWPYDTSQGELDYDPYKFEMGCLGIILCQKFQPCQHCIPSIHFLAPFLDRLITDRLELRFTSYEALQFFEEMRAKLTPEQCSVDMPIRSGGYRPWEPEKYDRWQGLPDEFLQQWGHFRAPKPSLYTRFLRRLILSVWGEQIVIEAPEPEIDESLVRQLEAKRLWGSLRSWFLEKGYTLFEFSPVGYSFPLLDTPPQNGEYPYAFCGGNTFHRDHPLYAYYSDKICFAQDSQVRHVAIKKLNKPDEIRIYQFLFEKRELLLGACILSVLEVLEYKDHCFAITPRYVLDYLPVMTLKCLNPLDGARKSVIQIAAPSEMFWVIFIAFLSLIIRMKDLKEDNTLVNHFGAYRRIESNSIRPELRAAGLLTYTLFDFDLSLMLPSNDCRLPAGQSFEVLSITWPYDTSQGEIDYDPYKFEMGCLGIMLCQMFQNCIPFAHFLAPFLDRLITHRLKFWFTSLEALQFFEVMRLKLTPQQLSVEAPVDTTRACPHWEPEKYNRWENLPDDLCAGYAELSGVIE